MDFKYKYSFIGKDFDNHDKNYDYIKNLNKDNKDNKHIKCIICGDTNVGKTHILDIMTNQLNDKNTIVSDYRYFQNFQILDIGGDKKYRNVINNYFNDKINVVIIVFDYSNKESIIDIHNWLLKCNNQYIFLIGTNFTDNEKLEINLDYKKYNIMKIFNIKKFIIDDCSKIFDDIKSFYTIFNQK